MYYIARTRTLSGFEIVPHSLKERGEKLYYKPLPYFEIYSSFSLLIDEAYISLHYAFIMNPLEQLFIHHKDDTRSRRDPNHSRYQAFIIAS
jgi:hypothetical protein